MLQFEIPSLTRTQNNAPSHASTGNALVNLYFKLTRDVVENPLFFKWIDEAWEEDPLATMRLLFNARDCRGGKGDRDSFLKAMVYIYEKHPEWFYANCSHIPEYGRYLDWIELMRDIGEPLPILVYDIAAQLIRDQERMINGKPVSLLAKWIPSEGKFWDKEVGLTKPLCRALFQVEHVTSYYRKRLRQEYLTPLRAYINIVESKMCGDDWENIDFSKVPGVAMHRLKKAFKKHTPEKFQQWLDEVQAGKNKVNAKTVYPHTLVADFMNKHMDESEARVAESQWNVILEDVKRKGSIDSSLVVCDVSGSMAGTPMEVAIALGILISSLAKPPFQNALITFSEQPEFFVLPPYEHRLQEKVKAVRNMKWGYNTNFQKVFDVILERATKFGLTAEDMPKRLYVLSDMQFDMAFMSGYHPNNYKTTFDAVKTKYAQHGYAMPEIVFWNLRSDDTVDFPVKHNEQGVALLSGFSPSILKNILNGGDLSPMGIVRNVINDERYQRIQPPSL